MAPVCQERSACSSFLSTKPSTVFINKLTRLSPLAFLLAGRPPPERDCLWDVNDRILGRGGTARPVSPAG
jgi:hypothetical protein